MISRTGILIGLSLGLAASFAAVAQTTPGGLTPGFTTPALPGPSTQSPSAAPAAPPPEAGQGRLSLYATFGGASSALVAGVKWRVFEERAGDGGEHALIAESSDMAPSLTVPDGAYIVHAAYGLAAVTRRIVVNGGSVTERIPLNAGALKITGQYGDQQIQPNRLKIAIYVPERSGLEAKLVAPNIKPGETVRLPEGNYRIVSTYLDPNVPPSAPSIAGLPANATNSVINAEVRIEAGKLTEANVRHRAANITLKLVNARGGEALANTSFTVLTPGGDVIREMIGAFPSLVLAEGEYTVIARRDGKTHQMTFQVPANGDREVEIMAN